MLILITVFIASTASHRVTESFEDLPPDAFNTTTLFPVANRTAGTKPGTADVRPDTTGTRPDRPGNATDSERSADRSKVDATVWKIEAAFGESKLDEKDSVQDKKEASPSASPPLDNKTRNSSEDFRPSPHLETYIEDDSLDIFPTRATIGDFRPLKKPPSGFISFPKDYKTSFHHSPKDAFKNQFPYKIESSILTRAKSPWRPSDPLDSKPTMEVPMRIPAGSLYEAPDAFKEKPGSDDEDLGLTFNDLKDNSLDLKKRVNPLKNLLRLLTAFIPVGLIISALTPNIVTVQSTGPGLDSGYSPHLYRRSDSGTISQLAAISEPCRRRLLCELRSEDYYEENPRSRRRQCHRLRCEEPEALARMLRWLLSHRRAEKRGQHYT